VFGYLVKPFKFNDLPPAMEVARGRFLENQELEKEVKSLEHKLEARKLIDIAKGILIDQYGLGETDAFRRIQTQSMQMRKSMKEIAEAIILAHNVQQGL
jgi:response regulator NasT